MSRLVSIKICKLCSSTFTIYSMTHTKNKCPKCNGLLIP